MFRAMFQNDMEEATSGRVEIKVQGEGIRSFNASRGRRDALT